MQPLKVFVIGGTGLVGSHLLPMLIEKGYETSALTRSPEKIERIERLGARGIIGDIRQPQKFAGELPEIIDCIVLLAMPGIKPGKRITRNRKEELRQETNDFFRNSMDLAIQYNVPIILPLGTSYRTEYNEIADETWPIRRVGITEIGKDADDMVNDAIKGGTPKIVQLIYGKIYGNGSLFRFMYEMMMKGRFGIIGKGENCIPNIHAADAASAILKAIEKMPVGEKFIIADDTPVSQKDFTLYMAELLNKKKPRKIPAFIIKLVIGRDLFEIVSTNCIVSNQKAKRILGWKPQYPSYREGLKATLKEMQESKPYFG
jgi:nucleoside-diphosphate-sugar epimerase